MKIRFKVLSKLSMKVVEFQPTDRDDVLRLCEDTFPAMLRVNEKLGYKFNGPCGSETCETSVKIGSPYA